MAARGLMTVLALPAAALSAERPNILHILLDDWGWADASWHRPASYKDLQSPNMLELVKQGVELDRHYVYKYCSPTRSAVQSGRNPIHVNALNLDANRHNPKDSVSGFAGIPRNMTGMAEHLLRGGYDTHMYGKWDAGMATPEHTPHGRGYRKSLHYFHHTNDYWTMVTGASCAVGDDKVSVVDLWDTTGPAHGLNNSASCSQESQEGCVFEDQLFTNAVVKAIRDRDESKPFFIFWAPHVVHTPLQVPQAYLDRFDFIDESHRQFYHAMVFFVDEAIGNVTKLLKSEGLWENTLVVVHADNGGPIYHSGSEGANNYPLKGGKFSNWEGGIRVNAFASGGLLPKQVRGTKQTGLMAGWDWYATYAALAGVDPTDHKAAAANLPGHDSLNLWPLISGQNATSPRAELALGAEREVGGLIRGGYKLVLGTNAMAGWPGPVFPNTTSDWDPSKSEETCGNTTETGCLFHIMSDAGEHVNVAKEKPHIFENMLGRIAEINLGFFNPNRGSIDPRACELALGKYGGFWGPFVDVDDGHIVV